MFTTSPPQTSPCVAFLADYELRFQSLFHTGRALAFPCNAEGDVYLDELTERARENYLFARAVVGHEYANPVVQRTNQSTVQPTNQAANQLTSRPAISSSRLAGR